MRAATTLLSGSMRRPLARLDAAANRLYGWRYNPLYHSGAIAVALLLVLIVTGVYLLLFYRIGSPYASVERIADQAWTGQWIRSLHRYASDAALLAIGVHAFRMYAQKRSWGPRALAWVSGLFLVFLFFVCGWTGYVMVWDTQAHMLAAAGARLLDVLPIFSEPISRTFVGERAMPSAFFFINFFLHVALPLGLGLGLWIHVARIARPSLLPSRRLGWTVVGVLVGISILWPIGMAPQADLLRLPGRAPIDLVYGFWIPVAERASAGVVWLAFLAVSLGLLLVPVWVRPRGEHGPQPSVVDERSCTGCEQCYHDCPYEAISMVDRTDGRAGMVARVDPALCVSCGICAGSCAPMVVGPPGRSGRDQLAGVKARIRTRRPGPTDVVLIACDRGAGGLAADGGQALEGVIVHRVRCAGSLHTSVIEHYLRTGAGGVMVVACPPRDCWSREGGRWVEARMFEGREAELKERVDRKRVHLSFAGAAERTEVLRELHEFRARLAGLALAVGEDDVDVMALCDRADEPSAPDVRARTSAVAR
jgi:coenzyme F420-reducing hydrogenase delta subunit/Pyruvate/2-oxoacid:ferredoxin oxidoreductase delta subunit